MYTNFIDYKVVNSSQITKDLILVFYELLNDQKKERERGSNPDRKLHFSIREENIREQDMLVNGIKYTTLESKTTNSIPPIHKNYILVQVGSQALDII